MRVIKRVAALFLLFFILAGYIPQKIDAAVDVSAKSALLMTGDGEVLYEKNALEPLPIASTTKIMTAWLALESGDLDSFFTVDSEAIQVEGSSMGLCPGDQVTMRGLVYGMLLPSGNDAANAAAVRIDGSVEKFVNRMNRRAEEIGMKHTHFATPSGLDSGKEHYSTAHDMAILAKEALKNRDFLTICSTYTAQVEYGNPPYKRSLTNHNKLLKQYPGTIGVKTGFTKKAGRCLVAAAQRNGVRLIAVVLCAPSDWQDCKNLFDYGFSLPNPAHLNVDFSDLYCPIVGGEETSCQIAAKEEPVLKLTQEQAARVERKIYLEPFYYAPMAKGERLGKADYLLDGKVIASVDLISARDCRQEAAPKKRGLRLFFR